MLRQHILPASAFSCRHSTVKKFMTTAHQVVNKSTIMNMRSAQASRPNAMVEPDLSTKVFPRIPLPPRPANYPRGTSRFYEQLESETSSPRPDSGLAFLEAQRGLDDEKPKESCSCSASVTGFFTHLHDMLVSVGREPPVETAPLSPVSCQPQREPAMNMQPATQMLLGWYPGGAADEYYHSFLTTPIVDYRTTNELPATTSRSFATEEGSGYRAVDVVHTSSPLQFTRAAMPARQQVVLSDSFLAKSFEMNEQIADEADIAVVPVAGRVDHEDCFSVGSFDDDDAESEEADGNSPVNVPEVIFTERRTSLFSLDSQDDGVVVVGQSGTAPGAVPLARRSSLLLLHSQDGIDERTDRALPSGGAVFASHRDSLFSLNSEDKPVDLDDSENPPVTYEALHADAFITRHDGPQRDAVHIENIRRYSWQAGICKAPDSSNDGDVYEEPAYELEAIPHPLEPDPVVQGPQQLNSAYTCALLFTPDHDQACLTRFVHLWEDACAEPVDQSLFAGFDSSFEHDDVHILAQRRTGVLVDQTTVTESDARLPFSRERRHTLR